MNRNNPDENHKYAIAIEPKGNPDGKARNGLIVDWQRSEPRGAVAKPRHQLLVEFFTSMLVLSATFKFRPVMGTQYFLYWFSGEWCLSLIAPEEWTQDRRDAFLGTCVLQRDMTWTIAPYDSLNEDSPVSDALGRFYEAFAHTLDTDRVLEDILPFHISSMPYYQRLYASALSRSIRASLTKGNQTNDSCINWQTLLPGKSTVLLESVG